MKLRAVNVSELNQSAPSFGENHAIVFETSARANEDKGHIYNARSDWLYAAGYWELAASCSMGHNRTQRRADSS